MPKSGISEAQWRVEVRRKKAYTKLLKKLPKECIRQRRLRGRLRTEMDLTALQIFLKSR